MKKEKIVLTPLQSLIKKLQDDSLFKYASEVDYEYDTYYPCENGADCCNNDYCRCSIKQNTRVTSVNFDLVIKKLSNKCYDLITEYCIDRVARSFELDSTSSWEVLVQGGYYGEEIHGVCINESIKNKMINIFLQLDSINDVNKVKLLLTNEYGYLLKPIEKLNTVSIKSVPLSEIKLLNDKQYRKVSKELIDYYGDYTLPRAICTKSGKFYTVIDGYHRMISAINKKEEIVSIIEISK